MHLWHDISPLKGKTQIKGIIEIPKGSRNKYELDKEIGILALGHTLLGPAAYPINYGFIPRAIGNDGDPLDIIVFSRESFSASVLVTIRPIGAIPLTTDGETDNKILAVPIGDPDFGKIRKINEIPKNHLLELREFLATYKDLENERVHVGKFLGKQKAWSIIHKSMKVYLKKFGTTENHNKRLSITQTKY